MAFPVTLNGRTYTLTDFEGTNYVDGLPDAFEDFVTHAGDIYNSTSTTSNSIGTGSKTFTVESAKPYQAGTPLRIADAAAPSTNFMDTIVTSYSGTTLVVDAVGYAGSGTFTSWNVNIGGAASVAGTVAIAQGGTGATTAAAARTNLDVYSKADADSRFLNVSGEASDVTMTGNVTIGDAVGDTLTVNATADFNTGINVDGTITADGLTVDNGVSSSIRIAGNGNNAVNTEYATLEFYNNDPSTAGPNVAASVKAISAQSTGSGAHMVFGTTTGSEAEGTSAIDRLRIHSGGDITFYDTDGATASFVYDASAGTTFNEAGADRDFRVESDTNTHMLFVDASANKIGMGTSSPINNLHIDSTGSTSVRISGDTGNSSVFGEFSGATDGESLMRVFGYQGSTFYGTMDIRRRLSNEGQIVHRFRTNSANRDMNIFDGVASVFNEDSQDTDFRVESDGNTHALFVDAGADKVAIGSTQTNGKLTIIGSGTGTYNNLTLSSGAASNTVKTGGLTYLNYAGNSASVYQSYTSSTASSVYFGSADTSHRGPTAVYFMAADGLDTTTGHRKVFNYTKSSFVINDDSNDIDFRLEGNNVADGLVYNADDEVFSVFTNSTSSTPTTGITMKRDGANSSYINIGHNSSAGDGYSYVQFIWNGGRIGEVRQNGTTGVTYVTTSDYRLKENVTPITSATERLKQLNPVRFNFIREADRTIDGFLAHEVQSVVPEAVSGTKDEVDNNGNPEYQGLDASRLVPLLVATIKELEARITALESN